jgi:hypothetical protein
MLGFDEFAPRKTVLSVFFEARRRDTSMNMSLPPATPAQVAVVSRLQRRRRWTPEQKLVIVKRPTLIDPAAPPKSSLPGRLAMAATAVITLIPSPFKICMMT